jgi:hypothetical protein
MTVLVTKSDGSVETFSSISAVGIGHDRKDLALVTEGADYTVVQIAAADWDRLEVIKSGQIAPPDPGVSEGSQKIGYVKTKRAMNLKRSFMEPSEKLRRVANFARLLHLAMFASVFAPPGPGTRA